MGWLEKMKSKFSDTVSSVTSLSQAQNTDDSTIIGTGEITDAMKKLCRKAAAEGAVLIKNDGTGYPT